MSHTSLSETRLRVTLLTGDGFLSAYRIPGEIHVLSVRNNCRFHASVHSELIRSAILNQVSMTYNLTKYVNTNAVFE